jgi:hypothetical protein
VFATVLGLTEASAEVLRNALLAAAQTSDCRTGRLDQYGRRYVLDFQMRHLTGKAMVRSVWIIRTGETLPRFVSCYVL